MKHRTAHLEGALLDAAVALADGRRVRFGRERIYVSGPGHFDTCEEGFCPSTDWSIGGPIIEREKIDVRSGVDPYTRQPYVGAISMWFANKGGPDHPTMTGPTPLIAAMRAYVASKLGEEVELP